MKKYIVLFVFLFSLTIGFAQDGNNPPNPGGEFTCPCCDELADENGPLPGQEVEYQECMDSCALGESPCAPIDSGILILLSLGLSLGAYKVYKNKKRQFEN